MKTTITIDAATGRMRRQQTRRRVLNLLTSERMALAALTALAAAAFVCAVCGLTAATTACTAAALPALMRALRAAADDIDTAERKGGAI